MNHRESWQQLHQHYMIIKEQYNLYTFDIIKQLGHNPYPYYRYLLPSGNQRCPSAKPGTIGRKLRDFLEKGMNKTDWSISDLRYDEKLHDLEYDHRHIMSVNVINPKDEIPKLEVNLCMNEGPLLTEKQLSNIFTIDGIVPEIVDIRQWQHLI
jgi:hypothetical protein